MLAYAQKSDLLLHCQITIYQNILLLWCKLLQPADKLTKFADPRPFISLSDDFFPVLNIIVFSISTRPKNPFDVDCFIQAKGGGSETKMIFMNLIHLLFSGFFKSIVSEMFKSNSR